MCFTAGEKYTIDGFKNETIENESVNSMKQSIQKKAQQNDALWRVALVAVCTTAAFDLLAVLRLELTNLSPVDWLLPAGALLVGLLTPLLARWLLPNRLLLGALSLLGVVWVGYYVFPQAGYGFALVGVGAALLALPLARVWGRVSDLDSAYRFAVGIYAGFIVHVVMNTWVRAAALALALVVILCGLLLLALWQLRWSLPKMYREPDFRAGLPLALLGPFFALQAWFFQSSLYIELAVPTHPIAAFFVILLGNAVALTVINVLLERRFSFAVQVFDLLAMAVIALLASRAVGMMVVVVVVSGQAFAGWLLLLALHGGRPRDDKPGVLRTAGAVSVGGALFAALMILGGDGLSPLVSGAAGALLGLAALLTPPAWRGG